MDVYQGIAQPSDGKLVLLVMDGLGGLPQENGGPTELEAARKPVMDALAARSSLGMMDMVVPGVTPGSGPGHLALFGYDPLVWSIGRGVLSALGIDFDLTPTDVALRGNFCTLDKQGRITDRRAGRIPTSRCEVLCRELEQKVGEIQGVRIFVRPEKEHRFVVVFRGEGLDARVGDTDPQKVGEPPKPSVSRVPQAFGTAERVNLWATRALQVLSGCAPANGVLLRGAASRPKVPTFKELYGLRASAVATYPMYRGLARLVGMEVLCVDREEEDLGALSATVEANWSKYDYFFVHVKKTDSYGEDGKFEEKVKVIERVDAELVPRLLALKPAVLAITGDHSTPAVMKGHSWHPVPVLLHAQRVRGQEGAGFGERACARGALGRMPGRFLLAEMLAAAGRLAKYGA